MSVALSVVLLLDACNRVRSEDITLTVHGVEMPQLNAMRGELEKLSGVSDVRTASFADGKATIHLRYKGTGAELAGVLAKTATMKDVSGFDDRSVQIGAAPVARREETPVPLRQDQPQPQTPQTAPAPKDTLAYRMQQWEGGTFAVFDNWDHGPLGGGNGLLVYGMAPKGRQQDFGLLIFLAAPNAQTMERLFVDGPQLLRQYLPGFQQVGQQQACTFGGDEARIERYEGNAQGKKTLAQAIYIKKKDIAVAIFGNGTEQGFREFGRAVEIVAQSISFKESPLEPGLVGTWVWESRPVTGDVIVVSYRYITIYPNGTFTDRDQGATSTHRRDPEMDTHLNILEGGGRGKIVKRGNVLTFHYDNGKVWNATYVLKGGNGLVLNEALYIKQ